ncbi:MAG: hypothetical protein LKJ90_03990 [Faecalibacterium sp.]|jgi:hypothetical protein|nr:hypothetical protein [Faecalibacterium sp.]
MKKTMFSVLMLSVGMAIVLSACGTSGQEITNPSNASQAVAASSETPNAETQASAQTDAAAEMPAAYAELLNTYVTALNEKWDGNALMGQGLNLIASDFYDGTPLDNIGYAVMDLDGNGTDELAIGTTANVTDDFYGKLIFDLYTLEPDGSRVQVLSSTARNRYYYAGEQLFVDLGSSSADDSTNATMRYEGKGLTDTNTITDPANYVQMDLIPLSQWTGSTATVSGDAETSASSELTGLLDEINQNVATETPGSHMAAVPIAVKLLNWGVGTEMTTEEIHNTVVAYMMPKGNDELVAFSEKMSIVDQIYQKLLGADAQDLLSSAGCEDAAYPWSDAPIETIEAIMNAVGLR